MVLCRGMNKNEWMMSRLALVVKSIGEPWSTGQKKLDAKLGEEVESCWRCVPESIVSWVVTLYVQNVKMSGLLVHL